LALEYTHAHKIIHRDIKSENIFLDDKFNVKLGDYGVARSLDSTMALVQFSYPRTLVSL
jgi:serine/threonine protein kinase